MGEPWATYNVVSSHSLCLIIKSEPCSLYIQWPASPAPPRVPPSLLFGNLFRSKKARRKRREMAVGQSEKTAEGAVWRRVAVAIAMVEQVKA